MTPEQRAAAITVTRCADRVWAGVWDAEKVIAVAVAAPTIVALMAWRWDA